MSKFEDNHAPPKDLLDEETVFSLDDSLDGLPLTPLSRKNDIDSEYSHAGNSMGSQSVTGNRRDSRIKAETMLSRVSAFADVSEEIFLEQLFEYIWPEGGATEIKGGPTYYVIQELLADFLKIKAFKRRYPDIQRRICDAYERSWLLDEGLVPSGRADLGLTALLSDDVMTILQNDFPEIHVSLSDLFRQRRFQQLADRQKKQYEAARITRGEARAELARKRALESASDFNRQLITERHKERRCYWDLQTMQIHVPQHSYRLLEPPAQPNGAYPVAVIPGQFTEHFIDLSPSELAYIPLSKALCTLPPHLQSRRPLRPPPLLPTMLRYGNISGAINSGPRFVNAKGDSANSPLPSDPVVQTNSNAVTKPESVAAAATEAPNSTMPAESGEVAAKGTLMCTGCRRPATDPIRCSQCTRQGHPLCLDLPESMVDVVRTYAWSCMECKQCVECEDTGDEEKMMFCDRCDRGYHAYCVGLGGIPDGDWKCPTCDPTSARPPIDKSPSPPLSSSRANASTLRRATPRRKTSSTIAAAATPDIVVKRSASTASLTEPPLSQQVSTPPRRRGRPPKKVALTGAPVTPKRIKVESEGSPE